MSDYTDNAQSIVFAVEADPQHNIYLEDATGTETHEICPAYYDDYVLIDLHTGERLVDGSLTSVAIEADKMGLTR